MLHSWPKGSRIVPGAMAVNSFVRARSTSATAFTARSNSASTRSIRPSSPVVPPRSAAIVELRILVREHDQRAIDRQFGVSDLAALGIDQADAPRLGRRACTIRSPPRRRSQSGRVTMVDRKVQCSWGTLFFATVIRKTLPVKQNSTSAAISYLICRGCPAHVNLGSRMLIHLRSALRQLFKSPALPSSPSSPYPRDRAQHRDLQFDQRSLPAKPSLRRPGPACPISFRGEDRRSPEWPLSVLRLQLYPACHTLFHGFAATMAGP